MVNLKEQKEAFVTGHEGTSPQEILLVCASGIVGYWLYSVLPAAQRNRSLISTQVYLFWFPMILVQSNFLYPWGVIYLLIELMLAVVLEIIQFQNNRTSSTNKATIPEKRQEQHGALTVYRAIVMYLTFVAILAVDFPLFPRRFAKTETRGYSLMDVGAASFSQMAGLASPRARNGQPRSWYKGIRRTVPLVFMGSLRLLTHTELEYQEHVSEYGVHWNFFYTLAALELLTALVPGPSWTVPTILLVVYQYFLSIEGVQTWIEEAPRHCGVDGSTLCNLFLANREGVLGCIGYVSLYLICEWIGEKVLWNASGSRKEDTLKRLCYVSGVVLLLWRSCIFLGLPISRRSTNLGFVLWSLIVNLPLSACILAIYQRHGQVPYLATLVNRHGLACFVVANLLTGIVNLSINTLQVNDWVAMGILLAYMTAVSLFAMLLEGIMNLFNKQKQA